VCCAVAHIERCVTSAWPGISAGRIAHTAVRGLSITAFIHCLCMLSTVAMESNETLSLLEYIIFVCVYFGCRTSVLCSEGAIYLFPFRK
jgi:hypothetical protein